MSSRTFKVGVDVGGTFTDLMATDGHRLWREKTPSTPTDPTTGVLVAVERLAGSLGLSYGELLSQVATFVHGTTVGTNALLQGQGPVTGLVTTAGFRDTLEIRRGKPGSLWWDLRQRPRQPLVPRMLRRPVRERIGANGEVVELLKEEDVHECAEGFTKENVGSIAVALLFSYVNPTHEYRVRDILAEHIPGIPTSLSCEVAPREKEFERTSTTVANAFVEPVVTQYLRRLERLLRESGLAGQILVTQSNGGLMDVTVAAQKPVHTVVSGPAAGVTGAGVLGKELGEKAIATLDMGGTSFDVALVKNGNVPIAENAAEIAGHVVDLPMVRVETVGTGGGSIAYLDRGGLLRVGPESAGANPGPACYGKGGGDPTVTDAYLVSGFIDPHRFIGGEQSLEVQSAYKAIKAKLAEPLNITVPQAAAAILSVATESLAGTIARKAFEHGEDIREFTLLAAGGAGPLVCGHIAEALGAPQWVCMPAAPEFCAFGMLLTDVRHDLVASKRVPLDDAEAADLEAAYRHLENRGRELLRAEGFPQTKVRFKRSARVRYKLQIFELEVQIPGSIGGQAAVDEIIESFIAKHQALYGFEEEASRTEITDIKVMAWAAEERANTSWLWGPPKRGAQVGQGTPTSSSPITRQLYMPDSRQWTHAYVYPGENLQIGDQLSGPAVVEHPDTTVMIPNAQSLLVDEQGSYVVTRMNARDNR